jgi:hypothetical protein
MTDEPQQEKEEQLTEKEKQCWDKLEEEKRRRLQAKNARIDGEAAQTSKHEASLKIKTNKADGNVNSDRQSKPIDSNPSSNTRTSEHEEIALLFRMATDKLDQVEANAEKEKQQIVRDLARELEKFRPIDRIASEIVEELREKVSKSVIYAALDERYKTSYRVQNARKRKKQKENKTGSLAPTSELKPLVVDTSGYSTQQLVSETYSSDAGDDNKPQDNEPVNINEKQKVGGNTDTNSSPPVTREVTECEHCQLKNSRIKELEDIVRKTTQLTPANQIAEENDNKICSFVDENLQNHVMTSFVLMRKPTKVDLKIIMKKEPQMLNRTKHPQSTRTNA